MYCEQCGYNNPPTEKFCRNCERDLSAGIIKPGRSTPSPQLIKNAQLIYAGFWVRFIASLLDVLLLAVCLILIAFAFAGLIALTGRDSIVQNPATKTFLYWAIIIASVLYHVLMESGPGGATLGKRWMNIRIVDTEGKRLTVVRALSRLLARLLTFLTLYIGFLLQPFTRRKQGMHDMLAGTLVVQDSENKKISIMASLLVLLFTLLVPVVALFSTAGLPLYQQYVLKVQLNNGMQVGQKATQAIAAFYRGHGRVPVQIADADSSIKTTHHVSAIEINQQNGELTLTFSNHAGKQISNKHLLFTPALAADHTISWQCHSSDLESRLLPASCK